MSAHRFGRAPGGDGVLQCVCLRPKHHRPGSELFVRKYAAFGSITLFRAEHDEVAFPSGWRAKSTLKSCNHFMFHTFFLPRTFLYINPLCPSALKAEDVVCIKVFSPNWLKSIGHLPEVDLTSTT